MVLFVLLSVFVIALIIGIPIAFCLGLCSLAVVLFQGQYPMTLVAQEVIYAGIEFSAFDLVEALSRKDTQAVFRIFEHLSKGVEPQMILGALNWHYTRRRSRPAEHGRGGEDMPQVFLPLHEADAAVKTSRPCALEMLLMQLLKITPGQNRFQQPQVRHSPS